MYWPKSATPISAIEIRRDRNRLAPAGIDVQDLYLWGLVERLTNEVLAAKPPENIEEIAAQARKAVRCWTHRSSCRSAAVVV
jgi:hypothetical protein